MATPKQRQEARDKTRKKELEGILKPITDDARPASQIVLNNTPIKAKKRK